MILNKNAYPTALNQHNGGIVQYATYLNCIVLGLVRAKVCTENTHQHNELD
jgi:hypothetical protein